MLILSSVAPTRGQNKDWRDAAMRATVRSMPVQSGVWRTFIDLLTIYFFHSIVQHAKPFCHFRLSFLSFPGRVRIVVMLPVEEPVAVTPRGGGFGSIIVNGRMII